jgi:HK97 family phage major capsid protein
VPIRIPYELLKLQGALEATWDEKLAELRASGTPLNAYDNLISRTDAGALMPEEVSTKFLEGLTNNSAVLQSFTHVPVTRAQVRFPVLSALPVAYWVTGDTGLKQTTEMSWSNKYLNIEEIAAIVPIPENVLDDSGFPIWDQVRPLTEQAAGRLLDATVFFGTSAPSSFPTNVVASAISAGNTVNRTTNNAAAGGFAQDVEDLLGLVEADGYDPNSGVAVRALRGFARKSRNTQGDRSAEINITRTTVEIDGVIYTFPMRGQWPTGTGSAEAILYDPSEFVVGVRQDVSWKLLDQAAIFDNNGNLIFNLPQQDMVAIRMTMRVGWQVANTINYDQQVEANRYPAGVLRTP